MSRRIPSMEEVLRIIKEKQEDALQDRQRLLALFADLSKGQMKAQQNQLEIFLKCNGNTCILNLRNAPKQKQQTEYARLILRMANDYGMQETVALDICGAFWHAVHDTPTPDNHMQVPPIQPQLERITKPTFNTFIEIPEFDIESYPVNRALLHHYHGKASHIVIPDGVTGINNACFANQEVESVVIPNGVTCINELAFYSCRKLKTVIFPDSLQFIRDEAFRDCVELETVILPKCMEEIGNRAFAQCKKLKTIHFTGSLKYLGGEAFYSCDELKTVILPQSLEKFGLSPFPFFGMEKIVLSGRMKEIYTERLGCTNVEYVRVSPGTEFVKYGNISTHIRYLEIPDTVRMFSASPEQSYTFNTTILASEKWIQKNQNIFQEYPYLTPPSALDRSKYYKNGQWAVI